MADRIPMTPRGVKKLREELKRLREVERPKNVQDIEIARAHGDISENAEFAAAKERQAFIEGRSREIDSILAQSGATVRLADTDSGEETSYSIVGDHEGDIKEGRLTISAPLARALIGREKGDTVTLRTGKGSREYQIVDVRFLPVQDA